MIVTDKKYHMEPRLIKILDLMSRRCTQDNPKLDSLLLADGDEGTGKTTIGSLCGYYVHSISGRKFNEAQLFFNIDELIKYAQSTEGEIIIWDEAALGGLSVESFNKEQIKVIKLLMVCRKKRHFFILHIPHLKKLKDYFIDRALGLIHTYARRELELGRFTYYKKKSLRAMYDEFRRTRKMNYRKYISFRGTFPDGLSKVIDVIKYDKKKDLAIMSIGNEPNSLSQLKLHYLMYKIASMPVEREIILNHFEITRQALNAWRKRYEKNANAWKNHVLAQKQDTLVV